MAAQEPDSTKADRDRKLDSLYIAEVEAVPGEPYKVLHAEPLYIDLIRDLGARKGEKEWNFGFGITDNLGYDVYEMLVEYEWAVADRLGVEIETPFTFYGERRNGAEVVKPSNRMESLKLATQWTFLVSEKAAISLALGYIHEFELSPFDRFGDPLIKGNLYNPFFIAAKRWGTNWHTLIYTGPRIEHTFATGGTTSNYEINSNLHYMIPGTRNFIGLEFNKLLTEVGLEGTLRPQMRVSIAENFLVGIVTGIPVDRSNERFSMFTRLIWEPGHKH
ncbi:MAG: phosphoribosylformylglycinamidine synthase [Flavobacteriales bacterium]|nr:phosphoribosylformylglycinamidine synthase [Flavobacteriales bacterium]